MRRKCLYRSKSKQQFPPNVVLCSTAFSISNKSHIHALSLSTLSDTYSSEPLILLAYSSLLPKERAFYQRTSCR